MRYAFRLLLGAFMLANAVSCSKPNENVTVNNNGQKTVPINFSGGYDTDARDRGRPVVLIGSALGVTPEVFRNAFSGVTPSRGGPPSAALARANKKVLMDALSPHGVSMKYRISIGTIARQGKSGSGLRRSRLQLFRTERSLASISQMQAPGIRRLRQLKLTDTMILKCR